MTLECILYQQYLNTTLTKIIFRLIVISLPSRCTDFKNKLFHKMRGKRWEISYPHSSYVVQQTLAARKKTGVIKYLSTEELMITWHCISHKQMLFSDGLAHCISYDCEPAAFMHISLSDDLAVKSKCQRDIQLQAWLDWEIFMEWQGWNIWRLSIGLFGCLVCQAWCHNIC